MIVTSVKDGKLSFDNGLALRVNAEKDLISRYNSRHQWRIKVAQWSKLADERLKSMC